MRILTEASAAYYQVAGIGRYSRGILSRIVDRRPADRWTFLRAPAAPEPVWRPASDSHIRERQTPFSRRRADQIWFRANLPLDARLLAGRQDLVYSPDFTAPPVYGIPAIVTIHDLAFITHPQHTTDALRRYLTAVVPGQVERADHVVAVSEATRSDLISILGVQESKISIVGNGVDSHFHNARPLSDAQRLRLGLPARYLLMVGTIEPRKNHIGAFRAIHQLDGSTDVPLVVVGRPGWGYEAILEEAGPLEASGKVVFLDHVDDRDMPALYASAEALIYPSWSEGFGLPVVEAFAAGTRVITGDAPALREVGGGFAQHVDPADVAGLAMEMTRVLETRDSETARESRRQWALSFSWDDSVDTLARLLMRYDRNR